MDREVLGTVVSTMEGPSPSRIDFVINNGKAHKGMFVELEYSEGTMIAMVDELIKTNRYFERPDSVKAIGDELEKNFPAADWEFLIAKAKPLGVFTDKLMQRSTFPASPGTKVYVAENDHIKKFLKMDEEGLNLGQIQFHDVLMKPNLSKLLQKHLALIAQSGAGKCVKPDTKIKLSDGRTVEIQSIVDNALKKENVVVDGVETSTVNGEELFAFGIDSENKIVKSKIKAFMRRKAPKEVLEIKTWSGQKLELTKEHPVPIFQEGVQWIQAKDLCEGDYSFVPRVSTESKEMKFDLMNHFSTFCPIGNNTFKINTKKRSKTMPCSIEINEEVARLFAYLLAEGHNFGGGFSFTNNNKYIMDDFKTLCGKIFFEKPKILKRENEVRFYNKALCSWLSKVGFTNSSWTKFVSEEILQSSDKIKWAFLSAFIDCDGGFSKRDLEVTLASNKLIESINEMFLQLGIVPYLRDKQIDNKIYKRLFVSGSKNLKVLLKNLNLLVDYKQKSLNELAMKIYNSNVDVLPNCSKTMSHIMGLLNMPICETGNYIYHRKNPSINQVSKIVNSFEKRMCDVELTITKAKQLFYSLPNIFEEEALGVVCNAYGKFDFNQISHSTGISSTTARRVVRGITNPKFSSFILAQNCLKLNNEEDVGINTIVELDYAELSIEIRKICQRLGFEVGGVLSEVNLSTGVINSWMKRDHQQNYSNFYKVFEVVFKKALILEQNIAKAKCEISSLKSMVNSGIFFDKIVSIKKIKPKYKFVYDLSVEHSSFIADNIMIHNSYCVSVLLEELLSRTKEQGQIAVIAFDTHGEYTCFGEPSSEKEDYSNRTKVIDASKIKLALSGTPRYFLEKVMPSLTPMQKRELFRIMNKLSQEMKSGVGPYGIDAIRSEVNALDSKTSIPLNLALDDLEKMSLFSKVDSPAVLDLLKPGELLVIDLNGIINSAKKQLIVAYFSSKLFNARRQKRAPPFALLVEEAHNFIPEGTASEHALARPILQTIAREGRKFCASLILVSQRPKRLDTTTLANCNTHIILRITNPYDLDHIKQSSEGLDSNSTNMISSLRVGEAMIVGEAVSAPTFFKVRERKSSPSKHETTLEDAAKNYSFDTEKQDEEADAFL